MKNLKPLYRKIADELRSLIQAGHYHDGRLPSDRWLTRHYATSRPTVTKAMRELETAGLILRRSGAGSFVNPTNRGNSNFVSTIIAGINDADFFVPVCSQIAEACQTHSLNLVWGVNTEFIAFGDNPSIEHLIYRSLRQNIKGVFFVPAEDSGNGMAAQRNHAIVEALTAAGIVVILLDRDLGDYSSRSKYDLVGIDNFNAGYQQANHLIKCGCRKIVYVTHRDMVTSVQSRIAGMKAAISEKSGSGLTAKVCVGDAGDEKFLKSILKLKPDGIIARNDQTAVKIEMGLLKEGIKIPDEIQIISIDDARYIKLLTVPLTTMRQPVKFIGEEAARLMALRLNRDNSPPRQILFNATIVCRASTKRTCSSRTSDKHKSNGKSLRKG